MNVARNFSRLIALSLLSASAAAQTTITLDSTRQHQSITGWEATAQAGQDFPAFRLYSGVLFDRAVDDLGINRLRLEVRCGVENRRDYWSEYRNGQIDYATWRASRYSTVNDNDDPMLLDMSGFNFAGLDSTVESLVLPMKQRLEARGEKLYINVNYVAFVEQNGAGKEYHHDDSPEEYAEFVLATYIYLRDRYGLVPDAWEVILEPDNTPFWRGDEIGRAIVAAANRLEDSGFVPRFIAPSTTSMANAVTYFDAMIGVPGVVDYLDEISYHRYSGVSIPSLQAITDRGMQHGLNTSMLEHIGSGYHDLYEDLKIGNNSAWQQFALAFPGDSDDGSTYFLIDTTKKVDKMVAMGSRTRYLAQYFRHVRAGALRIDAKGGDGRLDPLAFINYDRGYVVVIKASGGGSFSITGLPAGRYGVNYTTADEYRRELSDSILFDGEVLHGSIPAAGVVTVFARILQVDTIPPQVAIIYPDSGAIIPILSYAIGHSTVYAEANDNDRVAGVRFKINGNLIAEEDTLPPYEAELTWNNAPEGEHVLVAIARDIVGNTGESKPVPIVTMRFGDTAVDDNGGSPQPALRVTDAIRLNGSSRVVVRFELPYGAEVEGALFDLQGRELRSIERRRYSSGVAETSFDSDGLSTGHYLFRLVATGEAHSSTATGRIYLKGGR